VLYDGKERVMPDAQVVEFTAAGHPANVNNATNANIFLTYRRAADMSPCNEMVVMDICVIVGSKGEKPPHSFMKIEKSLNKGMVGADVYICYKKSINRADLVSYKPVVQSRFPLRDIPAYSLEETVALFCLPMGATLECWPADSVRSAAVKSTFVLTLANRSKVYGTAITFYEEVNEGEYGLSEEQKAGLQLHKYRRPVDRKIFTNKCVCVLSRWPFFDAFERFLFLLYKRQMMGPRNASTDIPLERLVAHFFTRVPFPSPSRPRILCQLSPHEKIAFSQPEELPLPRCGASFRNMLIHLEPDNCLLVLLLALTEQKILLHSLRPAVLTSVAEAVMQIIFPFYWQCPYIPLCPIGMSDYLAAPLPFIIGLDSRFFDLYDQPADVNAVDLDTNTVTLCEEKLRALTTKLLPKRAARQLRQRLIHLRERCRQENTAVWQAQAFMEDTAGEDLDDGAVDIDLSLKKKENILDNEIREAFLKFMVSVLSGYKHFLLPITSQPTVGATDAGNLFDQAGFLRSRDRNFHKFYSMLMRTQMFTKFIEERSFVSETNTCLAFFDECVERAELISREASSRGGSSSYVGEALDAARFLEHDANADNDRTLIVLPPEAKDLPEGAEYHYDTFSLDARLFPVADDVSDADGGEERPPQTPAVNLARRTKQEIRSAQKMAARHIRSPYYWARFLINTAYSLWYIHLPGYSQAPSTQKRQALRVGLALLQRMKRLRLHPADEICYRVMMQLCGAYHQPTLAVKVLFEMRNIGLDPNAVTYGYYNKAVLESEWPSGEEGATPGQLRWGRLRNLILAMSIFRRVAKEGNFKAASRAMSASTGAVDAVTGNEESKAVEEPDGVSQTSSELSQDSAGSQKAPQHNQPHPTVIPESNEEEEATDNEEIMNEKEDGDEEENGIQMRDRLSSIVKPSNEEGEEMEVALGSSAVPPMTADEARLGEAPKRRLSFGEEDNAVNVSGGNRNEDITFEHEADDLGVSSLQDLKLDAMGRDSKIVEAASPSSTSTQSSSTGRVKYTDIRGKFTHLFEDKQQNKASVEEPNSGKRVNRSLFTDESGETSLEKTASTSSLKSSPLTATPVMDNDPLGALRTPPDEGGNPLVEEGMHKSATLPAVEKGKPGDDILGN